MKRSVVFLAFLAFALIVTACSAPPPAPLTSPQTTKAVLPHKAGEMLNDYCASVSRSLNGGRAVFARTQIPPNSGDEYIGSVEADFSKAGPGENVAFCTFSKGDSSDHPTSFKTYVAKKDLMLVDEAALANFDIGGLTEEAQQPVDTFTDNRSIVEKVASATGEYTVPTILIGTMLAPSVLFDSAHVARASEAGAAVLKTAPVLSDLRIGEMARAAYSDGQFETFAAKLSADPSLSISSRNALKAGVARGEWREGPGAAESLLKNSGITDDLIRVSQGTKLSLAVDGGIYDLVRPLMDVDGDIYYRFERPPTQYSARGPLAALFPKTNSGGFSVVFSRNLSNGQTALELAELRKVLQGIKEDTTVIRANSATGVERLEKLVAQGGQQLSLAERMLEEAKVTSAGVSAVKENTALLPTMLDALDELGVEGGKRTKLLGDLVEAANKAPTQTEFQDMANAMINASRKSGAPGVVNNYDRVGKVIYDNRGARRVSTDVNISGRSFANGADASVFVASGAVNAAQRARRVSMFTEAAKVPAALYY